MKLTENFTIRRLTFGDLKALRELNEVFAVAFSDIPTHLHHKASDRYLEKFLSREHIIVLAAFCETQIVGGLVAYTLEKYEQERSEVYIYDLAVAEKFRRQGIARSLIESLKPIAKNNGAWAIFVQADRVDTPAVKLYQSMGVQEEPLHFDIPVD
jgi:aminoglycoside 3-N-acetyltransferase I